MGLDELPDRNRVEGARVTQGPSDGFGDEEAPIGHVRRTHGQQPVDVGVLTQPALMLDRCPHATGPLTSSSPT